MRALCEANSLDNGSPGCFASLRSVQGAAPLAPLMQLPLPALDGETICLHRQFPIQSLKINTQILPLVRKTGGIFYLQIKEESTPTRITLNSKMPEGAAGTPPFWRGLPFLSMWLPSGGSGLAAALSRPAEFCFGDRSLTICTGKNAS